MRSQLDFMQSRGIAEGLCEALQQCPGNVQHVGVLVGRLHIALIPHGSPHQRDRSGNRGACCGMPRRASATVGPRVDQPMSGQRDERLEAQPYRCGPAHRLFMPLARGVPPPKRRCGLTRHLGLHVGRRAEPHERQHRGDRPPSWGEDGARDADVAVRPNRFGQDRRTDRNDAQALGRPREQSDPFVVDA